VTESLSLGICALGRAIDARGMPLDGGPPPRGRSVSLTPCVPRPDERAPIVLPLWTGIRVLDGLLTIGRGARIGIFGGPGTGKSTLIEAIVAGCAADAIVVALVGERGREAQGWIERRNAWTTVVCATSDRPPGERLRAAGIAVAHAGALRERGLDVLLVLDSLARVASASREIRVAAGEGSGRAGYPPGVFADLARLVEVAGALRDGSITLIASVIHDGDDRDPVSEAARSLLDGHVALSARLAQAGRFPAVDLLASTSRTMEAVAEPHHVRAARVVRRAVALLERTEDGRALGVEPDDEPSRVAIAGEGRIEAFLRQGGGPVEPASTLRELAELVGLLEDGDGNS